MGFYATRTLGQRTQLGGKGVVATAILHPATSQLLYWPIGAVGFRQDCLMVTLSYTKVLNEYAVSQGLKEHKYPSLPFIPQSKLSSVLLHS